MDDLKKGLDMLPKIVPLIYILGFIIINSYLGNYGFSDFNILNATYLKTGVLFCALFCFIFLAIYYAHDKNNLTDDIRKSWPYLLLSLNNILFINIIISFVFFGKIGAPNINEKYDLIIWIFLFTYFGFRVFFSEKYTPKNNKGILLLYLPQLILLLIINILYFNKNINSLTLFAFIAIIFFQIVISLGVYGDKNYKGRILSDIFMLVSIAFFFGSYLYEKIPSKFGGGETYSIVVNEDKNITDSLKIEKDTFFVLYENNERLLLKNKKEKILFTLKSELKSFEIKK